MQSSVTIKAFFLAMSLYPDVQAKAQAEIDHVVGKGLPTPLHKDSLPYVSAVVKETLRWHTVTPLGIPHKSDKDDFINGYLIPKGAILIPNVWFVFPEPRLFFCCYQTLMDFVLSLKAF